MPATIDVVEQGKVIVMTISDPYVPQHVHDLYPALNDAMSNAPTKVHTIVDLSGVTRTPVNIDLLRVQQGSPLINHPNSDSLIIVGASVFLSSLASIALRLTKFESRVKFCDTLEEAYAYLRESGKL